MPCLLDRCINILTYPALYLEVTPAVTGLQNSKNSKTLFHPHGTHSSKGKRSVKENNMCMPVLIINKCYYLTTIKVTFKMHSCKITIKISDQSAWIIMSKCRELCPYLFKDQLSSFQTPGLHLWFKCKMLPLLPSINKHVLASGPFIEASKDQHSVNSIEMNFILYKELKNLNARREMIWQILFKLPHVS